MHISVNNLFLKKERCVSQIRITLSQILEDEWQRIWRKRESRRKSERERGRGRVGDREKRKEEVKRKRRPKRGLFKAISKGVLSPANWERPLSEAS